MESPGRASGKLPKVPFTICLIPDESYIYSHESSGLDHGHGSDMVVTIKDPGSLRTL